MVGLPREVACGGRGPQILLDRGPALSVLEGSVFSPPDAQHPEKSVSGATASPWWTLTGRLQSHRLPHSQRAIRPVTCRSQW